MRDESVEGGVATGAGCAAGLGEAVACLDTAVGAGVGVVTATEWVVAGANEVVTGTATAVVSSSSGISSQNGRSSSPSGLHSAGRLSSVSSAWIKIGCQFKIDVNDVGKIRLTLRG